MRCGIPFKLKSATSFLKNYNKSKFREKGGQAEKQHNSNHKTGHFGHARGRPPTTSKGKRSVKSK
jgi:hypothetical protein